MEKNKIYVVNDIVTDQIINDALAIPGAKLVIMDQYGDMVSRFYQPGRDINFNALDERSVGWSVLNEVDSVLSIPKIAESIFPESCGYYQNFARDVFTEILYQLYAENKKSNSDICEAIASLPSQINGMLKSMGSGFIEREEELIVLSELMFRTRGFDLLKTADGDFSIEEWLRRPEGGIVFVTTYEAEMVRDPEGGIKFLTSYDGVKKSMELISRMFIDLLSNKFLDLVDERPRRTLFVFDEIRTCQLRPTIVGLSLKFRSWERLSAQDIGCLRDSCELTPSCWIRLRRWVAQCISKLAAAGEVKNEKK
jgi:predicted transcriptional regulator with HTH domain